MPPRRAASPCLVTQPRCAALPRRLTTREDSRTYRYGLFLPSRLGFCLCQEVAQELVANPKVDFALQQKVVKDDGCCCPYQDGELGPYGGRAPVPRLV